MNNYLLACLLAVGCAGCSKAPGDALPVPQAVQSGVKTVAATATTVYTIKKGEHHSNAATLQWVDTAALRFSVRFDSSAIYQTIKAENQFDINKLYGFSDNGGHHHRYSARIGWRWSDAALRLFAYVYNAGVRQEQELATVPVGAWVHCSIEVQGDRYLFAVNERMQAMPRFSTTPKGSGYLLYPYFGGDEAAPHDVRIEIKNQ
jgi:hypothetical protein